MTRRSFLCALAAVPLAAVKGQPRRPFDAAAVNTIFKDAYLPDLGTAIATGHWPEMVDDGAWVVDCAEIDRGGLGFNADHLSSGTVRIYGESS